MHWTIVFVYVCLTDAVPLGILSVRDVLNIFRWSRLLNVIIVVLLLFATDGLEASFHAKCFMFIFINMSGACYWISLVVLYSVGQKFTPQINLLITDKTN